MWWAQQSQIGADVCSSALSCAVVASSCQCVAVYCSALQCNAVCCHVCPQPAQSEVVSSSLPVCCSVLQCVAVYCSVLQCSAMCALDRHKVKSFHPLPCVTLTRIEEVHSDVDAQDALSCSSFSAKEPLILGFFGRK